MMTWSNYFFINPSSFMMEYIVILNDYVSMLLFPIFLFVFMSMTSLFFFSYFNFTFFENEELELIWTLLPFFILSFLIIPTLCTLFLIDTCYFCGLTVFISGHQWYWTYCYKELNSYSFDSYMLNDSIIFRLLDVDNRLILPCGLPFRLVVSSEDVIHSWTLPTLGIKMDAIPGRLNEFCSTFNRVGVFFGQCSELCGVNHSFMPIVVESISFSDYMELGF